MRPSRTPGAETTAKPETTKPSTEKPPQMNYPYPYLYYLYYPYYPHYPYYPLPNTDKTTAPPAAGMTTTAAGMTTTDSASTTGTAQKTQRPYFPYFPYYPPVGYPFPGFPDDPAFYYYQIIHNYYGNNPYGPIDTTAPPASTAKPSGTTLTVKPSDSSPTTAPVTGSGPLTTSGPTAQTTTAWGHTTKPSSDKYPGPMSPYVPYYQFTFPPYVFYQNKAGKLLDDQKSMPLGRYKSGLQGQAHPHEGFHYWNPGPWFSHSR